MNSRENEESKATLKVVSRSCPGGIPRKVLWIKLTCLALGSSCNRSAAQRMAWGRCCKRRASQKRCLKTSHLEVITIDSLFTQYLGRLEYINGIQERDFQISDTDTFPVATGR